MLDEAPSVPLLLITSALALLIAWVLLSWGSSAHLWRSKDNLPPRPLAAPLLGNLLQILWHSDHMLDWLVHAAALFRDTTGASTFRMTLPFSTFVRRAECTVVSDPGCVEHILVGGNSVKYQRRGTRFEEALARLIMHGEYCDAWNGGNTSGDVSPGVHGNADSAAPGQDSREHVQLRRKAAAKAMRADDFSRGAECCRQHLQKHMPMHARLFREYARRIVLVALDDASAAGEQVDLQPLFFEAATGIMVELAFGKMAWQRLCDDNGDRGAYSDGEGSDCGDGFSRADDAHARSSRQQVSLVDALQLLTTSLSSTHSWLLGGSTPRCCASWRHGITVLSLRVSAWMTGAAAPPCSTDAIRFDEARQLWSEFVDHAIETQRADSISGGVDQGGGRHVSNEVDTSLEEGELTALELDEAMDAAVAPSTSMLEALSSVGRANTSKGGYGRTGNSSSSQMKGRNTPLPQDVVRELLLRFVGANISPIVDGLCWTVHQLLLPEHSAALSELRDEVDMCIGRLGAPDGYIITSSAPDDWQREDRTPDDSPVKQQPESPDHDCCDNDIGGQRAGTSASPVQHSSPLQSACNDGRRNANNSNAATESPTKSVVGFLAGQLVSSALVNGITQAKERKDEPADATGAPGTAMASAYGGGSASMPRLRATLVEAQRLFPTALTQAGPFLHATDDDTLPDGSFVRAGTTVLVHPFISGRQQELWVNPELFEPSRFLCDTTPSGGGAGGAGGDEDRKSANESEIAAGTVFVPPEPHEMPFWTAFTAKSVAGVEGARIMADGVHLFSHDLQQAVIASVLCVIMQHTDLTLIEPDSYTYDNGATLPVQGSLEVEVTRRSFRALRRMNAIVEECSADDGSMAIQRVRRHSFD